jgi:hypothetical protein
VGLITSGLLIVGFGIPGLIAPGLIAPGETGPRRPKSDNRRKTSFEVGPKDLRVEGVASFGAAEGDFGLGAVIFGRGDTIFGAVEVTFGLGADIWGRGAVSFGVVEVTLRLGVIIFGDVIVGRGLMLLRGAVLTVADALGFGGVNFGVDGKENGVRTDLGELLGRGVVIVRVGEEGGRLMRGVEGLVRLIDGAGVEGRRTAGVLRGVDGVGRDGILRVIVGGLDGRGAGDGRLREKLDGERLGVDIRGVGRGDDGRGAGDRDTDGARDGGRDGGREKDGVLRGAETLRDGARPRDAEGLPRPGGAASAIEITRENTARTGRTIQAPNVLWQR